MHERGDVMNDASWIVCQIGRREHYVLAAGLHERSRLLRLFTDAWAPPKGVWSRLPSEFGRRLGERFAPALETAPVEHFTASLVRFELASRAKGWGAGSWRTIIARNAWFQRKVVERLRALLPPPESKDTRPVVFAFSYAAREIFRVARQAGCHTVLGQIDPGLIEEELVAAVTARDPDFAGDWTRAPRAYWQDWIEECGLADTIVVNSPWSAEALIAKGIPAEKLEIVPLAYEPSKEARNFERVYPERFTEDRPLRVLFLGTLNVRKGLAELLAAAREVQALPIRFDFVGPELIRIPAHDRDDPRLSFHGPAAWSEVHGHYRDADLFILPTLSDGFALTQIEAQSWGLPVVATRRCGEVVSDGVNGLILDPVTPETIAASLAWCARHPEELTQMSKAARRNSRSFMSGSIVERLLSLPERSDRTENGLRAAVNS